jgi:hypothetical protein
MENAAPFFCISMKEEGSTVPKQTEPPRQINPR